MMDLLIRQATLDDMTAIRVLKPVLDRETVLRRIEETTDQRAAYLLAWNYGMLLGHVFLKFYGDPHAPDCPTLEDLYVHPDYRGQGIGTALLQHCETLSRELGFLVIQLSVGLQNPRARKLYDSVGYVDTGHEPYLDGVYDGVEEWVIDMRKKLRQDHV